MDGPPPPEEDFSALSIPDRLAHKNWKARVNGYEALIKLFGNTASDDDPAFKPYINNSDLLKKIVTDSNAVAQEKGVECLIALVKFAGETAAKTREVVVPALVDKCFGSSRAGTKNHAIELAVQYVEAENGGAGVVNDILPGLGAKQPKAVAGCVSALKEIIRLFGTATTPPPPVLKALPKIFGHSDKTVRAEGNALALVIYQYLGPGIEPWLADLKPVQVKELKEAFEGLEKDGKGKGTLKPERMTRAQAREAAAAADAGEEVAEDAPAQEEEAFDPRQFAEAVDIVPKLPASLQENLKSSKWKERKEVLDELLTLLNATVKIQEASELSELAKSLAIRVQSDANIPCVIVAASCIEALAKGLSSSFAKYREAVVPPMLERLKERKTNVTDQIGAALDAVFATTTLPDVIPDLIPFFTHKNPQVKEGTLKFLGRCLSTSKVPIQTAQIKPIAEGLATLLEDGFEGARNEAATCFATLLKMVGERPLNATMDGIADIRKAKVKEMADKVTVKCKAGAGAAAPKPPAAAAAPPPGKKKAPASKPAAAPPPPAAEDEIPGEPPKKPAPRPPAAKKPPAVAAASAPAAKKPPPAAAAPAAKGKAAPAVASGALDTVKYKHTPEDAEALAAELIPAQIMTDLSDANWKTRLAALEEMTTWVEGSAADLDGEVVVRALAKKGWSEKNFQVSAKLYAILQILSENCPSFGRSSIALSVGHLAEKLGDAKLKKPAGDALIAFAEKASLQFVLNQAYDPLSKQKAPKVLADAVAWMNTALIEFGIAGVSMKALIDFLKVALGNSNAAVRTSATKTLVTVKQFAGPSIITLLEDLNAQLFSTIQKEFEKVEGVSPPEPTRTSADLAEMTTATGPSKGAAGGDPLDDLFPRVEIDGLLKGTTILADTKSEAWKTKKEGLETLQAILEQGANQRLKPSMGEIGQILKARVVDTNKAVQTLALDVVAKVATGMGKPFEKHSRLYALPVATVLSDQKAPIRAAALKTLSAIATACEGVDSLVGGFATALEAQNPLQRATLLGWLAEWFKEHQPGSSLDLNGWVTPILGSLDDRNGDVRKGAQALIPILVACCGYDYVMQQTNTLKSTSRGSAAALVQAARGSAPAPAAPAKAAAAPKAAPAPAPKKPVTPPPEVPPSPPPAEAPKAPPASKLTGVRRKLPLGPNASKLARPETPSEESGTHLAKPGGLKRPAAGAMGSARSLAATPVSSSLPFTGTNADAKRIRLKDPHRWINEGGPTRKDLADTLQTQMESHASKQLVAQLFSHDHNAVNDHIAGLTAMCDFYTNVDENDDITVPVCLANLDLPLKYASIKVHESQSNLIGKCVDLIEALITFMTSINYQLSEGEATCFIPTFIHKLGDAREQVRIRVQNIVQSLPKVYAYSRVFQLLMEHGLKSKVAKTRQGSLDEMAGLLKRHGIGACDPAKAFPAVGAMIADKDPQVRKSALSVLSEGYMLVGEKVWKLVGSLSPKDKTQLEERLRRVAGPSTAEPEVPPPQSAVQPAISRLAASGGIPRPGSPAGGGRFGAIPRPSSPSVGSLGRFGRPTSPSAPQTRIGGGIPRPDSPSRLARPASPAHGNIPRSKSPAPPPTKTLGQSTFGLPPPGNLAKPKMRIPSKLARPGPSAPSPQENPDYPKRGPSNGAHIAAPPPQVFEEQEDNLRSAEYEDITVTISSILSSDANRSVDALKKIQKILSIGPDQGPLSPQYRELADHTEGLIETINLQMSHIFEHPDELVQDENFRLAKHLIQTLNTFCDHNLLAESLTVDILTSLLEELTLRLLESDDSANNKVKDLSRFINMIILRLFATGRRMSIFRALFALLLRIVKPFPSMGALPESKEARVAELVLKCVWKLARNIPQDLTDQKLDPVELFPSIEHFLQSVPPNEWRARATNKVPCGDMPLRTIKVIIQHVVAHYGDDVYDLLSAAFDDPSATIVYPYVYRILNSASSKVASETGSAIRQSTESIPPPSLSPTSSRPMSPRDHETVSSTNSASYQSQSRHTSGSGAVNNGYGSHPVVAEEPDPDAQLLTIIGHISSETTGALHKEGITELHHFLKAYPHKRPRVDKMLESTGAAFRKYINRALASRAAEDQERNAVVADTLSKLESNTRDPSIPTPTPTSPTIATASRPSPTAAQVERDKLNRLHDLFRYNRSSAQSNNNGS